MILKRALEIEEDFDRLLKSSLKNDTRALAGPDLRHSTFMPALGARSAAVDSV
jgi:hypothetical protein